MFASGINIVTALGFDTAGDLFEAETDTGVLREFINYGGNLASSPVIFATGLCAPQALTFFPGTGVAFTQSVSSPGGPTLTVTYTPPNYAPDRGTIPGNIVVSWPANGSGGLVLQTTPSLAPAFWSDYGGNVVSYLGISTVTIPVASTGSLYIRLASSGSSY